MEKREFKIGDKVKIPKTKSKDLMTSLENCSAIQNAKNLNQDYLYINRIIEDQYDLGAELGRLDSAFGIQDLEHYEEEFVLPECWFVLYNTKEEFDIINKFYDKGWAYFDNKNMHGYHNNGDNQIHTNNWVDNLATEEKLLKNGYIQITFEQFQKYVLKQETMEKFKVGDIVIGKQVNIRAVSRIVYHVFTLDYKRKIAEIKEDKIRLQEDIDLWFYAKDFKLETMEKEIIGYKLIKEYPGSKGLGYFEKYTTGELNKYPEFWKPVYKEEKQIIQMYSSNKGMFEIEVVDGKAYYRPENKELPEEWIRDIINSYDDILIQQRNGVNPYSVIIAELHVGCYKNCRKEDWEKVYKLLK